MDDLVLGSLSMRLFNFKSKVVKCIASGRTFLSRSSFQISLAKVSIEYASAALEYKYFFYIDSNEFREPCGPKT